MQLVLTTHESRLLDKRVLRNDEIWFVKSSEEDGSEIYPLDSFMHPGDDNIDLEYLRGRFEAIPNIIQKNKEEDGK